MNEGGASHSYRVVARIGKNAARTDNLRDKVRYLPGCLPSLRSFPSVRVTCTRTSSARMKGIARDSIIRKANLNVFPEWSDDVYNMFRQSQSRDERVPSRRRPVCLAGVGASVFLSIRTALSDKLQIESPSQYARVRGKVVRNLHCTFKV